MASVEPAIRRATGRRWRSPPSILSSFSEFPKESARETQRLTSAQRCQARVESRPTWRSQGGPPPHDRRSTESHPQDKCSAGRPSSRVRTCVRNSLAVHATSVRCPASLSTSHRRDGHVQRITQGHGNEKARWRSAHSCTSTIRFPQDVRATPPGEGERHRPTSAPPASDVFGEEGR